MNKYKGNIKEIFEKYQYAIADKATLNNVDFDVYHYLYNNGYNSDYNSKLFKPLIPNVNYKLSIEDVDKIPYLQLELLEDDGWYVFK